MKLHAVAAAVLAVSLTAACGSGEETKAPTSGKETKPVETLVVDGHSDDWLQWESGKYVPANDHPDQWTAKLRAFKDDQKIIFIGLDEQSIFGVQVTKSFRAAAEKIGLDLTVLNNEFPDAQKPLTNAETAITQQPDLVINYNGLQNVYPAILEKFDAAGIPVITLTFKNPGVPVFGADNFSAGAAAGEYLAKHVIDNQWPAAEIWAVSCDNEALGPFVRSRINGAYDALSKNVAGIPSTNYVRVDCKSTAEEARAAYTDWLTANPQAKYIVATSINDIQSVVMANVLKAAGRDDNAAVVGQSADPGALEVIRAGDPKALIASISFSTDLYGKYMLALAADVLDGKPVPAESFTKLTPVDKGNIDTLFPAG